MNIHTTTQIHNTISQEKQFEREIIKILDRSINQEDLELEGSYEKGLRMQIYQHNFEMKQVKPFEDQECFTMANIGSIVIIT